MTRFLLGLALGVVLGVVGLYAFLLYVATAAPFK